MQLFLHICHTVVVAKHGVGFVGGVDLYIKVIYSLGPQICVFSPVFHGCHAI